MQPLESSAAWLPPADDMEEALKLVSQGASGVLDGKPEKWGLWDQAVRNLAYLVRSSYEAAGWEAPKLTARSFWSRLSVRTAKVDVEAYLTFMAALGTPLEDDLREHIEYRLNHDGNVHIEFSGPTGMAKSSCAIGLADSISKMDDVQLAGHLSFDVNELPVKLAGKRPGQTVIQDEYVVMSGEGSKTAAGLFQNLEDTLRASGVNLFVCSPRKQEHGTMQAELELVLWNPKEMKSLFIAWIDGKPEGVVALPWCRAGLYEVYKPWKAANVERTKGGRFRDQTYLVRLANRIFEDPKLVAFLTVGQARPRRKEIIGALKVFHGGMMSKSEMEALVDFLTLIFDMWDRVLPLFESSWGEPPGEGLAKVAARASKE